MSNNNGKTLVPRNRDFSNFVFADDLTEFAELETAQPPTLPVSAYTGVIVAKLQAAGYNIIAQSMKDPRPVKIRIFETYLTKADLNDDVRYSMAMMQPDEDCSRYEMYKGMTSPCKYDGIGAYVCNLDQVVKFHTGIWRK